ncbi:MULTISPECIES: class I SAM-dependent methyltransferase [unclassified Sphingobacterium]|uniref:class I SAM-dependent methyltransferase n=1 Tax=unclassified Sphingobacterium TaxID=2609468 RepID=UPI0025D9A5DA|nr:class I SAM-dependent methyltransferase [Sphingobacterium sp. UBA5670]
MEFWERSFVEKQEMWGTEAAQSAIFAKDFFLERNIRDILIPGFGYGRNGRIFLDNGFKITGIEISKTAIELARKYFGTETIIYHGSVNDMPFDTGCYGGIFCYALIHLLDADERAALVRRCFDQLAEGGYMIFTSVSKQASIYGKGEKIGAEQFAMFGGINMFFYDFDSIHAEFDQYGLLEIREVEENFPFYIIICQKRSNN